MKLTGVYMELSKKGNLPVVKLEREQRVQLDALLGENLPVVHGVHPVLPVPDA